MMVLGLRYSLRILRTANLAAFLRNSHWLEAETILSIYLSDDSDSVKKCVSIVQIRKLKKKISICNRTSLKQYTDTVRTISVTPPLTSACIYHIGRWVLRTMTLRIVITGTNGIIVHVIIRIVTTTLFEYGIDIT